MEGYACKEGDGTTEGSGSEGYTKYPAESAPKRMNGGNDPKHDHVKTSGPKAYPQDNAPKHE